MEKKILKFVMISSIILIWGICILEYVLYCVKYGLGHMGLLPMLVINFLVAIVGSIIWFAAIIILIKLGFHKNNPKKNKKPGIAKQISRYIVNTLFVIIWLTLFEPFLYFNFAKIFSLNGDQGIFSLLSDLYPSLLRSLIGTIILAVIVAIFMKLGLYGEKKTEDSHKQVENSKENPQE